MYQTIRLSFLFIIFSFFTFAGWAQRQEINYTLLESSAEGAVIRVDFPEYSTYSVDVNGTTMQRLAMKQAYPLLEAGSPELLKTAVSLIVPENSQPTTEIISSDYIVLSHFELAPSKGKLYRNINPASIAYMKGADYYQDRYIKDNTVSVGETYQLHDYHGVALQFYPFAYNPVQKKLKVYSSITVKVQFNGQNNFKRLNKVSKTFNNIYADHFLNYNTAKSTPLIEDGDILILAPANFCEAMQPYADWKIKNGYNTEIVPLSVAGSSNTAIKTFITNYYNSHNLVYVILVGDNGQFPIFTVSGNVSDNYYGEIAGNDKYADVIIGKISAENVNQVTVQVDKFIQYEQNPEETSHFPVFTGIGSSEGPGDNNEYDWQHMRNIDNTLSSYTYTSGNELFEGSHGGLDASGDPTASNVSTVVNAGTGIINYCGHGNVNLWGTTNFNNNNVNNLTNYGKLPFIISVACLNGDYNGQTCFAEAWLRANKNNRQTGAVGALMSTISQPWNSPMCAQDHMNNILTGSNNAAQKYTFGGICFNGIIKMMDTYNDYEVARTWILFGDPAMMVRTAVPQVLNVNYPQEVIFGNNNISVTSSVEGARVVLSKGGAVLDKAFIANGNAALTIPSNVQVNDTIHFLASAPNYLPTEGNIIIIPNQGPFVVCQDLIFHDNRNNDGNADYGETVIMDAVIKNIGTENASNITMSITTDDPYLTVADNMLSIDALAAESSRTCSSAFVMQVAPNAPAFHNATIYLDIAYDTVTRHFARSIVLHAPLFNNSELSVNDRAQGNSNNRFDLHETVMLSCTITNEGNSNASNGTAYISNPDGTLMLFRYPQEIPALAVGESYTFQFRAAARTSTPSSAQIHIVYTTENGYTCTQDLLVKVGFVMEDWESGDFTAFNWVNNSSKPWSITTATPYEGTYAVRSGAIGNSANSTLSISNTNSADDTLSFYYKVSSEEGYDFLKFFVDNTVVESWSGSIGWTKYSVLIPAGTHTFKWQYIKDNYMSSGQDMAMLDNINFPCMTKVTGIEESDHINFSVMPNPTAGRTQLNIPDFEQLEAPSFQLFDITGRMLQQDNITSSTTIIYTENYPAGIYLLKIMDGQKTLSNTKIVKE